jgi:hypothetical protein
MKFTVERDDGTTADVTDGVKALYDLLGDSMDWGSGFISQEELLPIRALEIAAGWARAPYYLDVCDSCGHIRKLHNGRAYRCTSGQSPASLLEVCEGQCPCLKFSPDPK